MRHILDLDITQHESSVLMMRYLHYKCHMRKGLFVRKMEVLVEGYSVKGVVTSRYDAYSSHLRTVYGSNEIRG